MLYTFTHKTQQQNHIDYLNLSTCWQNQQALMLILCSPTYSKSNTSESSECSCLWFQETRHSMFQWRPRSGSPLCSMENMHLVYFWCKLCQAAQSRSSQQEVSEVRIHSLLKIQKSDSLRINRNKSCSPLTHKKDKTWNKHNLSEAASENVWNKAANVLTDESWVPSELSKNTYLRAALLLCTVRFRLYDSHISSSKFVLWTIAVRQNIMVLDLHHHFNCKERCWKYFFSFSHLKFSILMWNTGYQSSKRQAALSINMLSLIWFCLKNNALHPSSQQMNIHVLVYCSAHGVNIITHQFSNCLSCSSTSASVGWEFYFASQAKGNLYENHISCGGATAGC